MPIKPNNTLTVKLKNLLNSTPSLILEERKKLYRAITGEIADDQISLWVSGLSESKKTQYLRFIADNFYDFSHNPDREDDTLSISLSLLQLLAAGQDGTVNIRNLAESSGDPILLNLANQQNLPYERKHFARFKQNKINNIITESASMPSLVARYLIANYYRKKYGVDIVVVPGNMPIINNIIRSLIFSHQTVSIGIVTSGNLEQDQSSFSWRDSHTTAAMLRKTNSLGIEVLRTAAVFSSFGWLSSASLERIASWRWLVAKKASIHFQNSIGDVFPFAELSSMFVNFSVNRWRRQVGAGPCATESFVQLKDGLRDPRYFQKLTLTDMEHRLDGPIASYKTTQSETYLQDSQCWREKADEPITPFSVAKGQSMRQHRAKHTRMLRGVNQIKNCYLIDKASALEDIVKQEYESYSREELNHIYNVCSGRTILDPSLAEFVSPLSNQEQLLRAAKLGHTKEAVDLIASGAEVTYEVVASAANGGHLGTFKMLFEKAATQNLMKSQDIIRLAEDLERKIVQIDQDKSRQTANPLLDKGDQMATLAALDNKRERYAKINTAIAVFQWSIDKESQIATQTYITRLEKENAHTYCRQR